MVGHLKNSYEMHASHFIRDLLYSVYVYGLFIYLLFKRARSKYYEVVVFLANSAK